MIRNRLGKEKSPYLLQHAANPVNWYPWCTEAFDRAQKENKPVFLSIGYSTCHWCHVMAHESFEDAEVAILLNKSFVCIKVDREERPDIDHMYMSVCQLMTGSGGWPLTLVLTPDKKPFFAATYIPKNTSYGRKGMIDLIQEIDFVWREKQDTIRQTTNQVQVALEHVNHHDEAPSLTEADINVFYRSLKDSFDSEYGGFGTAPKFPSPNTCLFLLRYWHVYGENNALHMVEQTLNRLHDGGIQDHVGGGFHRYSTDRYWLVPHFEKMLYDQALIMIAYAEAYQITHNDQYKKTVNRIIDYVNNRLTRSKGGFFSAEDADTEGEEGRYYLWSYDEIQRILKDDSELFCRIYDIRPEGNLREDAHFNKTGLNILYRAKPIPALAQECRVEPEHINRTIERSLKKLSTARKKRTLPSRDDKILTDWNGLMIAALALSGRITGNAQLIATAGCTATFIMNHLYNDKEQLLHRFRKRKAGIIANLDDYAFFTWGLVECYRATFQARYLIHAVELCDTMISEFWDHQTDKGFFFTSSESERLLVHQKVLYDGAIPSGNSVAYFVLQEITAITGTDRYSSFIERSEQWMSAPVRNNPTSYAFFLSTFLRHFNTPSTVTIIGDPESKATGTVINTLNDRFLPYAAVRLRKSDLDTDLLSIIPELGSLPMQKKHPVIYACARNTCYDPTSDIKTTLKRIGSRTTTLDSQQ